MASRIDCVIDTEPMAREMDRVSRQVDGTTAAVVGFKAAVIKAEGDAADHVCQNVNRGFYSLIHSQISQKIAKLSSEVDSHVMKLTQLQKQLLGLKSRMQRDYAMTSQRYHKLFTTLNRDLRLRVTELDRPVMRFASDETTRLENRTRLLSSQVPLGQTETLAASERILAGNVKYQAKEVLESTERFLTDHKRQEVLLQKVLLDETIDKEDQQILMPVIVVNSTQAPDSSNWNSYSNKDFVPANAARDVTELIAQNIVPMSNNVGNSTLSNELNAMISQSSLPDRVKEMMRELHKDSVQPR
ncbi:MAG: hypothetical protein LUC85_01930 [Bacteroidales bacterium]|nr:hypothetical protein [Bacteroidales bacterium]MCD8393577.1 hypothetical protein [Bacteroidales bacterium]